jgi:hypothetical protein
MTGQHDTSLLRMVQMTATLLRQRRNRHTRQPKLTCVLSKSHLSPLLLAVAGRASGTRPHVGPSALAGCMRAVPALSRRTKLPSPHRAMLRCR